MKKQLLLILLFLMTLNSIEAQLTKSSKSYIDKIKGMAFSFSAGITSPTGDFRDYSKTINGGVADGVIYGAHEKITGQYQFNLDASYQFGAFGLGLSIGYFSHELTDLSFQSDLFNANFPVLKRGGAIDGTYFGIGPDYTFYFSKFSTTTSARIGLMNFSSSTFTGSYNGADTNVPIELLRTEIASDGKKSLAYSSFGLKFSYDISKKISLFTKTDYFISLGDGLKVTDNGLIPADRNKDNLITEIDLKFPEELQHFTQQRFIKPKIVNVGFGMTWNFNQRLKHGKMLADELVNAVENENDTLKKSVKLIVPVAINKGLRQKVIKRTSTPKQTQGATFGEKVNPGLHAAGGAHPYVAMTDTLKRAELRKKVVVTSNNSSKRMENGVIKNLYPPSNIHFKSIDEIKDFKWELIGDKILKPQYIIEITKIGYGGQPKKNFVGYSTTTQINAKKVAKFKAGKALADTVKRTSKPNQSGNEQEGDGFYSWIVTETSTGISSTPSFFSVSSCDVDLQITKETIECLGYEGANRKYKICFSSTYQSSTGDLTYANPGSGLFVYDQSNNSLSPVVSPSLQTQAGSPQNTVNYCFEVLVNNSVTSIGFGLQGDDLDLTPITCQPGASLVIDQLPNCLCDDCDKTTLEYSNFTVSPQSTAGNQYNIAGNITANVPIYGMEVQIQSYSYNAAPAACSNGVTSIEESGMILLPATSINNVTNLQLFNETSSGSPNTNNNASKTVKYISVSPLSGPIPVNLTIGLPGPLPGFVPTPGVANCCTMNYRVCVKIKVFYDKEGCKSCTFTQCIEFNNK